MRRGWEAAAVSLALCACLSSANLSGAGDDKSDPAPSPTSNAATCSAADLQTDVGNCGACGKVCGNYANAYGQCKAAKCTIGCNTGYGDCDGKIDTGCESTLATDSMHCGACGHSCGGARCVAGQCQPYTLAELPGGVTSVAGDATHLYYAYDGGGGNYAIGRIAKDGSAPHADVVTGIADYPYALNVTATELYWVKYNEAAPAAAGDGAVYRASKTGASAIVAGMPWLSNLKTVNQLAVVDANAFFPTYDQQARIATIRRAAIAGGASVDNTTGIKGSVSSFTVEGAFLYYYAIGDGNPVAGRGLFKCPTSGCATSSTAVPGLPANASATQLTPNSGLLYFVQNSRTIARMKPTGEEHTALVTMDDTYGNIRSFAVDGQRVYWVEYHYDIGGGFSETYSAWSCPLANCSDGRQEIALRGQYVYALHVDDKAAYIVVRANNGTVNVTQVLKVVK
jgi:hypothetical protein